MSAGLHSSPSCRPFAINFGAMDVNAISAQAARHSSFKFFTSAYRSEAVSECRTSSPSQVLRFLQVWPSSVIDKGVHAIHGQIFFLVGSIRMRYKPEITQFLS